MEVERHRHSIEGLLLVCSDLFDSSSIARVQVVEVELWNDRGIGARGWYAFFGGGRGHGLSIDCWGLD